jgi:predicted amidophosphoribosyltransferase
VTPISNNCYAILPWWRKAARTILDLVYPPSCALCAVPLRDNRWLCGPCAASLPRLAAPFCEKCGEPYDGRIQGAFSCPNCHDLDFAFHFARPALRHHDATRQLIHELKYHRRTHLAAELGRLAREAFDDPRLAPALRHRWPLVPVPLHPSRLHRRHFNQSAEIARTLARMTGLRVVHALRRTRRTETQTRFGRHQRLANLRGAFDLSRAGHRLAASRPPGGTSFPFSPCSAAA